MIHAVHEGFERPLVRFRVAAVERVQRRHRLGFGYWLPRKISSVAPARHRLGSANCGYSAMSRNNLESGRSWSRCIHDQEQFVLPSQASNGAHRVNVLELQNFSNEIGAGVFSQHARNFL
jgi:hypothetical protein